MSAIAERPVTARPPALRDVPPFPQVASRLMRLVSEEDFSYKDVAALIRTDAAFSMQVLRLANSPVFGFRSEIKDIPHAIAVLGLNRLRAVVTTLAMREFLLSGRQHDAIRQCWRHNLATALTCETLAGAFWIDAGFGYTAGMLHDIGLLAMVTLHSDSYASLLNCMVREPAEFLRRERAMLGIDHCEAGHWLLTDWDLPEEFRVVAANHHQPPRRGRPDITTLVYLSCLTASMAGFPAYAQPSLWQPELVISQLPEKAQDLHRSRFEDLPFVIATKINSFDCDFMN